MFFYFSNFSFAGTPAANTSVTQDNQKISNLIKQADGLFVFISSLLGITTQLVGVFLNPAWTNGSVFGLSDKIHDLWILVSNIVYFIFMLILLIIAFLNIIGQGKGLFELKQALPRLIIGILMVPFSWLLVNGLLAFSSVLTASVLSMPFETFKNSLAVKSLLDTKVCQDSVIYFEKVDKEALKNLELKNGANSQTFTGPNGNIYVHKVGEGLFTNYCEKQITAKEILTSPHGIYGILNIYTYGVMALDDTMKEYSSGLGTKVKTFFGLLEKLGFDFVFILVYFILVIALFFALFIRGIRLWLYMIFSPVFGLLIFFGKGTSWGGDDLPFNIKELVSLAMVPVYVSGALSFGLLFIVIAGEGMQSGTVNLLKIIPTPDSGVSVLEVLGTFHLKISGDFSNLSNIKSTQAFNQFIGGGLGLVGNLIMHLFSLVILWIGVMSALRASKITKNIVEPIHTFGKSAGELLRAAPKYVPLPFTKGKYNMASLGNAAGSAKRSFESNMVNSGSVLGAKIGTAAAKMMGADINGVMTTLSNMDGRLKQLNEAIKADDINNATKTLQKLFSEIIKAGKYKNADEFVSDKAHFQAVMQRFGESIGLNEEYIKHLQEATNGNDLDTRWKDIAKKVDGATGQVMSRVDGKVGVDGSLEKFLNDTAKNISTGTSNKTGKINNILNATVTQNSGHNIVNFDGKTVTVDATNNKIKDKDIKTIVDGIAKNRNLVKESDINKLLQDIGAEKSKEVIEKELKKQGVEIISKGYEELDKLVSKTNVNGQNGFKITNGNDTVEVSDISKIGSNPQITESIAKALIKLPSAKNVTKEEFMDILGINNDKTLNEIFKHIKKEPTGGLKIVTDGGDLTPKKFFKEDN